MKDELIDEKYEISLNKSIMSPKNYIDFLKRSRSIIQYVWHWDFDEIFINQHESTMRRINDNFYEDRILTF